MRDPLPAPPPRQTEHTSSTTDIATARSFSRLLALEASRVLFRLGCDVRVFDPRGLPVKDEEQVQHEKVQELRRLSQWSDGHVWVSPEQHGNLVSVARPTVAPDRP